MNNKITNSELNRLIPPEIKNDEFYTAIHKIAREEDIKTILEIGSSSGEGSTEAFVIGLRENPNKPILFCMEISKTRFAELQNRYKNDLFVKCYNFSSVSLENFPEQQEVINFYRSNKTNLNLYPLELILSWLNQDIEYVKNSGVADAGIRRIKQENNIEYFDVVLIDGSEFTGVAELNEVYGAKFICLDDIVTFKNYQNYHRLLNDNEYILIASNHHVGNGYAIFQRVLMKQTSYNNIRSAVESVEGFMIPGQEEFLFNKVTSLPEDAVIVEIGSFKGRSTVAMGYACIGTKRKIYSIDTWDGNDSDFSERQFFDIWQQNVQSNGLEEYIVPLRGYSHDILSRWQELTDGKTIDFIFIDGSHQYLDVLKDFEMSFSLVKNGGWIAFHDVIHTWVDPERVWYKTAKFYLKNHEYSSSLACGQKNFHPISIPTLPINFFTIVLNGQPFIEYHIEVLKQLPFKWHWHIIEGVADLKHDTSWSVQLGGNISAELHKNGLSYDGTKEYLDELAKLYPNNITIYRKPEGEFWDGKREMVNAPLANIQEECLLWQVDVDELWTLEQICTAREMFITNPDKTAAFYWCWYFVGEKLIISTRNCYAQNPQQDWLRTWKFKPGAFWATHEPPILVEPLLDGKHQNIAAVNPFLHDETEKNGLVFQHFAYVTSEQLRFKEQYYGYSNAVSQWQALQSNSKFPTLLRDYFAWVGDETIVDIAESYGVIPIVQRDFKNTNWHFLKPDQIQQQREKVQKRKPIIIIDAVFFQLYQTGIARVWRSLLQQWANTDFADHLLVLDRGNTSPKINGIRYRSIPRYDYNNTEADKEMLQQICNEEEAELFISTYYTTPIEMPSVFMAYDMIPELLGGDLNEPMWREKHHAIKHASAYISISENTAKDLNKCFPDIPSESITVAHCGVDPLFYPASESEINAFKYKYGVTKPYFLLVGTGSGYKNGILFFQAFAKLASSYGFDIICTGIGGVLTPELRTYTSGSAVHLVQLSDEELALAYSGAVALVYPSKYEGFGMPLLEAMACGCPVITCPNASIPEVTGEAAIYVNDDDVAALANAMCEVQKPNIRQALITAGLAQSKNFSWTKMAEIVSSELINTTLLPLNLREINLIIFPDWSQPEDELGLELQEVIQTLATHPNSEKITLLINTDDMDIEDAEIFLSSVVMNILMEEDIDITEELRISLLIDLNEIQWQALLPCINARVSLEHENQKIIVNKQVEQIPLYSLKNFQEVSAEQFFFQLGNSLFFQSKYQEAIIQYQKFQQIQIGNPEFYWSFSECFRQLNLLEQCFAVLQEGIKLYPVNAKLHFTVIVNYQMSGRVQEAITAANIALDNLPNNRTFQLISNLILPSVYDQVEEINAYRQRFKQGLDNLINNIPLNNIEDQQNTLIATSCWTNFYLPYQADNVLILQSQYGNWLHQIMKANYPQWGMPLLMPPLKENQKIRIGYASHYLHSYSGTLWLTGWLRYCDHNKFEIYCYYTGNQADAITEKFQEYSDFFYHIPDNLPAVCEQIIADKLHILVYPEIGMDPPTIQMAGLRLAPVQCAAWGHPVTTGLPTIDYFLSSELMEGQNAQEHYSEKLILLPNIGVSYPKPYIPPVIKTRSDYGLSDDDVIYLCCQAPFKYLPQYDFIVAEIASRVSQAKFVFLRGNALKPRLQRAFAAVGLNSEDYCVHLNIPERLDYLMINLLSDVYLDTFTWSGGNTSLEAIACNLPIVTCPGEFMRGRHTDSFLKLLEVTDTIAKNEAEYIDIAVRLGLDKPWRRSIAERMSQNHDCLFDDKACVTGLESFYKKVCSKHFSAS
jgi:predicted O-linked N-acetylglucosamine transferase (SPINDLY family)/predicted O-methyltransferase YrrM